MKKTKMLGALVLSAALALGMTMPAFAEGGAQPYKDGDAADQRVDDFTLMANDLANEKDGLFHNGAKGNQASTDVMIYTQGGQIAATLPIQVSIVANDTGGPLALTPTGDRSLSQAGGATALAEIRYLDGTADPTLKGWVPMNSLGSPIVIPDPLDNAQNIKVTMGGYRIENRSSLPLRVTDVRAEDAGSGWAYTAKEYAVNEQPADTGHAAEISLVLAANTNTIKTKTDNTDDAYYIRSSTDNTPGDWAGLGHFDIPALDKNAFNSDGTIKNQTSIAIGDIDTKLPVLGLKIGGSNSVVAKSLLKNTGNKPLGLNDPAEYAGEHLVTLHFTIQRAD